MKRIALLLLAITIAGLVDTLPTIQSDNSIPNPGTFVSELSTWNPNNLDPATNHETQGLGIIQLCYDRLFRYEMNSVSEFTGSLAYINYTISSNGLQYTFWLKPNITFALQPGESVSQPFNAYVMQYSIDRAIIMNDLGGAAPTTIDSFIKGATEISNNPSLNVTTAQNFLKIESVHAINEYELKIEINEPFLGFINTLLFPVASAISPKAIIDNEPSSYTTNIYNTTFGMVPLTFFFPGMSNTTILKNLGLPSNYNLGNSGVVPNSPANVGSPNEYLWTKDHSAGTGPYIVSSNTQNSGAKLIRNSNWWNKDSFPVSNGLTTLIWKNVPDLATRISDLENGSADSINLPSKDLSQIFNLTTLQSFVPGINLYKYANYNEEFIGFNLNKSLSSYFINEAKNSDYSKNGDNYTRLREFTWNDGAGNPQMSSANNPFTSILFRKAFAYSFNYETYLNSTLYGFGLRMQGVIPNGVKGTNQNLLSDGYIPTYNPDKAKTLFNEVGFKGSITLTYSNNSIQRKEALMLLKQNIESLNVGLSINIKSLSWNSYLANYLNGNYSVIELGWKPNYIDAYNYIQPFYSCNGLIANSEHYCNPYIDSLITQSTNISNFTTKDVIYTQIEKNATQDFPYMYLFQQQTFFISRDWILGINNSTTNSLNTMQIFPSFQYLIKSSKTILSSSTFTTSKSIIPSTKLNSSAKTTASFEITSFLFSMLVFVIMVSKRKSKKE